MHMRHDLEAFARFGGATMNQSAKDEIARIEQLRERAFAATIADEADFARRWSQYHHALQAAYERGALVAAS